MTAAPGHYTNYNIELHCLLELDERLGAADAERRGQAIKAALRTAEARRELADLVARHAGAGRVGLDTVGTFAGLDNNTLARIQDDEPEQETTLTWERGGEGIHRLRWHAAMGRTVVEYHNGTSVYMGITAEQLQEVAEFISVNQGLVTQALSYLQACSRDGAQKENDNDESACWNPSSSDRGGHRAGDQSDGGHGYHRSKAAAGCAAPVFQ